jgi:transposase
LQQWLTRRRQLVWLQSELAALEQAICQAIANKPSGAELDRRLQTTPGVGPITAATLIADLPELGAFNRQQVAAVAGLAPFNHDSGKQQGKCRIFGGRADVRGLLYMTTLSAIRHNPVIKKFYQHLLHQGKRKLVALTACRRKLLVMLNAMLKSGQDWDDKLAPSA